MPDFAAGAEKSSPAKLALRNQLLAARRSLSPETRTNATAAIQAALLDLVRAKRPSLIAAYVPVGAEPGGADLPDVLRSMLLDPLPPSTLPSHPRPGPASGARPGPASSPPPGPTRPAFLPVLLPVLLPDNDLDWVHYTGPESLRPGPRGLREPTGPRLGRDAITEATLLIVPALAVDRTGLRMGRGGGSYDRVLARATRAYSVALLHDGEFLPQVPGEPHDRRVHAVITPAQGLSDTSDWTK